MSEGMDALITCEEVSSIEKEEFLRLKKVHGYIKAYQEISREDALDMGLHPLKEIVPIVNEEYPIPESYAVDGTLVFAFSYKKNYYIFSESY